MMCLERTALCYSASSSMYLFQLHALLWLANWLVYVRYLEMRRDGKAGLTKMLQRKKLSLMDITIRWIPATNSYLSGEHR